MSARDGDRRSYYTISLADGTVAGPIFARKNKDVESVLSDINRVVYGVQYSGFEPEYEFFDTALNKRIQGVKQALPNITLRVSAHNKDWSKIVFYASGPENPGDYLMYQNGEIAFLMSTREQIPYDLVNPVSEYTYKARDGLTIPTLITQPLFPKSSPPPAIMLPHGGPEYYDRKDFDWLGQYFANRGFLVIQPQFRGSEGFGIDFKLKGRGEWGRKMQDDLTDAVTILSKEGKIDPENVCIVGWSYGGYAALAGAVFSPGLYKCVVSINGVSDVDSMVNSDRRKYGKNHWAVSYWERVIGGGEYKDDHLAQISPINHVEKVTAPVLLLHGEFDEVVPFEQSEEMYETLKDANKEVLLVELERDDHSLRNNKNRQQALKAIDAFLSKHIK